MSFKNINGISIINNLKFEENVDSFIPTIVFLFFGHVIMHRFSMLFIDHRYKGNLTKWKQLLVVLPLHTQVFSFWLLFVQILEAIAQVCNSTITSCETLDTIRSIMTITYLIVAFFPMAFSLFEYIDQSARIVVEHSTSTELGVEGMMLSGSHRHIEEVKRPLAYKLKRSISSCMLRPSESVSAMQRSKTVNELDKISNIEDFTKQ